MREVASRLVRRTNTLDFSSLAFITSFVQLIHLKYKVKNFLTNLDKVCYLNLVFEPLMMKYCADELIEVSLPSTGFCISIETETDEIPKAGARAQKSNQKWITCHHEANDRLNW